MQWLALKGIIVADKPDAKAGAKAGAKEDAKEAEVVAPSGKKKMLLMIVVALVVLLVLALAGWFYWSSQQAELDEDDEDEVVQQADAPAPPKGPPTFLPLDTMVVNLADPGGEKVAQIGVTLELVDGKMTERVKPYLPAIRNSVLLLVSQSTAEELLKIEGKERLANDIFKEASRNFVADQPKGKAKPKNPEHAENPIRRVLFFSFIVQ